MESVDGDLIDNFLWSEKQLAAAAVALGAGDVTGVTAAESAVVAAAGDVPVPKAVAARLRKDIRSGGDPLGEAFCRLRDPDVRRPLGATYTPPPIVSSMVAWAAGQGAPDRVIDPGAGSGRFIVAAGRRFPRAHLVAVDVDPLAALLARAHLSVTGMAKRSTVVVDDFRRLRPERINGRTLWIGNPPYVRHHQIGATWKEWLSRTAQTRHLSASKLAGLHVHFFLATAVAGRPGDVGAYITASEWLDVNYGSLVRELLLDGLGGLAVHVLDAKAGPFADAATTGAITCFRLGTHPSSLRLRRVEKVSDLGELHGGRPVKRDRLSEAPRWTVLMRQTKPVPQGFVELGEICRVHRGAVTGANAVWVTHSDDQRLPEKVLRPSVTRARELFAAGVRMVTSEALRRVIDLPCDLDVLGSPGDDDRDQVERFLRWARRQGAHNGYIAKHRKSWWSVELRSPAPILATYMARRPPAFVRNLAGARHINIAHGLYPREPLADVVLDRLAEALRDSVTVAAGRTYAGGLTKFEPREMERLPVPTPELLSVS